MGFALEYCPHGRAVLARLRQLYGDRRQDMILASMATPSEVLRRFAEAHEAGYCDAPDLHERLRFWDGLLREQAAVEDDGIPSAYLTEVDQGLYGGVLGGRVQYMCDPATGWISSMVAPMLRDWSEFEGLCFDRSREVFQRYLRELDIFVAGSRGRFGVSHFILIDGLNFVFELFGATRTYMDLTERPEMVRQAIDFAFDLNVSIQKVFFEKAPLLEGGTCSKMTQWLPGRVVSESVDPFHMTSVDCFEAWGREPAERIFAAFDGGAVHIHGNGRHLLRAVATLKGLRSISLGDDRGFPLAFDVLGDLKLETVNVPLQVSVGFEPFARALKEHRLPGGVFYAVTDVPNVAAANRCMERVRAYRV